MMMREDCEKGFFVSFDYSSDALQEIESFFKRSHKVIVALTVQEILDELIALKLDSWAGSPVRRHKDKTDVIELISRRKLPRDLAVNPVVRALYTETWDALQAEK